MGILTKTARGFTLALLATTVALGAGTSAFAKSKHSSPAPEASDPASATYTWEPQTDTLVVVDRGVDENHNLRPKTPMTYDESRLFNQIDDRCVREMVERLENETGRKIGITMRAAGYQAAGSGLGVVIGFKAATVGILRQVIGLTFGTAFGGGYSGAVEEIRLTLGGTHASCVQEFVHAHPSELGDIRVALSPTMRYKHPDVLPPNQALPETE